ncbi:MAG: efflux RND transporter permease subunit [Methylotenera sp.]|nr:efflux RND transporter permease subunit [Oligoflexia bacterium]
MKKLYASPLRVYLALALLALIGLFSASKLPVSLFPNSSKPKVGIWVNYGSLTAQEFLTTYGMDLEEKIRTLDVSGAEVEQVTATYHSSSANIETTFKWGADPQTSLREVRNIAEPFSARMPDEVRKTLSVDAMGENAGFFALSFYSRERSLDELYDLLEPLLGPKIARVKDASDPELWNPTRKEVRIELDPGKMALLGLFPKDIERAIGQAMTGSNGGSITVGVNNFSVQMPRAAGDLEGLGKALVLTPSGQYIHLSDIAKIDFGVKTSNSKSFKTSGAPSLILYGSPRPGGNVKRMSEDFLKIVNEIRPSLPRDVETRTIVDPSEFIRASVNNVFHEVLIGALLAVAVLFIFIGSLRNVITAAIEIPLSMVLAFILMRMTGMNLNLISLGGLALSAGMNVDASVVVMENIFRHFEGRKMPLSYAAKLEIITKAVAEVRFSVIASTLASLVVFLPLAFTSDLSYAVLGDLAKTVVFSHGFSAFVAIILVPTVRLQLMSLKGGEKPVHSPVEPQIKKLENGVASALGVFLARPKLRIALYGGIVASLVLLVVFALPKLPKEIIGTPDTDWMRVSINTQGNTLVKQMELSEDEVESRLLAKFGDRISYTFSQVYNPNGGFIMARLRDKRDMKTLKPEFEKFFANTPAIKYGVGSWNPAELPIPDPDPLKIAVRGGTLKERAQITQEITQQIEASQIFSRAHSEPNSERSESIVLKPNYEQWTQLRRSSSGNLSPEDLAELARVVSTGRRLGEIELKGRMTSIYLRYPDGTLKSPDDLASLPIGVGSKIIPFKALADVRVEEVSPTIYREDGRELFTIHGNGNDDEKSRIPESLKRAKILVDDYVRKNKTTVSVTVEDALKDLNVALEQLGWAIGLSILLIFLTLVIQFGSFANAALVLVAIPLGFIGVITSLLVFRSTLSLNSVLGVILLNGIAVANSIILVDFTKRLFDQGMTPEAAAVEAVRRRLRPILITSLTTILGMLPIALGLGDGGKILQPLGIAVSGGLWVSMTLTLFVVPALQVAYLRRFGKREVAVAETFSAGAQAAGAPHFEFPEGLIRDHLTSEGRTPEQVLQ